MRPRRSFQPHGSWNGATSTRRHSPPSAGCLGSARLRAPGWESWGQLRKQDVFQRDDIWVIRITPEAGTVKTNEAREIPLHQQVVDLGFPDFVATCGDGHLFLNVEADANPLGVLQGLKNRLAEFGRTIVKDTNVAPNHGWRHRFKTVGMEAGIPPRILDAIQGQAARTVADTYGDVTLKTMAAEIWKLPYYHLPDIRTSQ